MGTAPLIKMTLGAGLALLTLGVFANSAGEAGLGRSQTKLAGAPNRTGFESSDAQWG